MTFPYGEVCDSEHYSICTKVSQDGDLRSNLAKIVLAKGCRDHTGGSM